MESDIRTTRAAGLSDLEYFVEWGGSAWTKLVRVGLEDFLGTDLEGQRVLDIGARSGRMSTLFAMLGADVTGVDVTPGFETGAYDEAQRWGARDRVTFKVDDGRLGSIGDGSMDIAFTKSVMVVIPDRATYLTTLARKLTVGGRLLSIENARGGALARALRAGRRSAWGHYAAYFADDDIATLQDDFDVNLVRKSFLPPVMLIGATKRLR